MNVIANQTVVINGSPSIDNGVLSNSGIAVNYNVSHDHGASPNFHSHANLGRGMNRRCEGVTLAD
jgi:hypothetical protein